MKKLFLRLLGPLVVALTVLVLSPAAAHANPARVDIYTGFQPWYTTDTVPLSNVDVSFATVGIPYKLPVQERPYYTRHFGFSAGDYDEPYAHPIWTNYAVGMDNGFTEVSGSVFGGTLKHIGFTNFAWCATGLNGIQPGEYHMSVTATERASLSAYGGHWEAYWQWQDGTDGNGVVYERQFSVGNNVSAAANNFNTTLLVFVFKENPPPPPVVTFQGYKVNELNQNLQPWAGANVSLDGGAVNDANNPYFLRNIRADQNHTVSPAPVAGYDVIGYKVGGPTAALTPGSTYSYAANTAGGAPAIDVWWYYRPKAAAVAFKAVIENGGTDVNPCDFEATDYRHGLCGTPQVSATLTSAATLPNYTTSNGPTALDATTNERTFGNLYPGGSHKLGVTNIPTGWKVSGYTVCTAGTNCHANNPTVLDLNTYRIVTPSDKVQEVYIHFIPDIKVNLTTNNCTTIAGAVSAPVDNIRTRLIMETTPIGTAPVDGASFSHTVPDMYRDGNKRRFYIRVTYTNLSGTGDTDYIYDPGVTVLHSCERASICDNFDANVAATYPSNLANAGATLTLRVDMKNPTDETRYAQWSTKWSNSAFNQLAFTAASISDGWTNDATSSYRIDGLMNSGSTVAVRKPGEDETFFAQVKAPDNPKTPTLRLEFQMAYVQGATRTYYGATCSKVITMQSNYTPWLRIQNGSAAAKGMIVGQPAAGHGMRDVGGTDQSINLEATYAVMSVVSTSNFCSTNAYNFGRTEGSLFYNGVNGGAVSKCDSGAYPFSVAQVFDGPSESFYNNLDGLRTSSGQCGNPVDGGPAQTEPNPSQPTTRYRDGGPLSGVLTTPSAKLSSYADCPTIYTVGNGGTTTLDARQISKGRVSILVNGDLYIGGNLTNDYSGIGSLSIKPPELGPSVDVVKMISTQNKAIGQLPNLGIIVSGNVIIDKSVTSLDAMIYAGGKINTCSSYPDTTGANGRKDPGNILDMNKVKECTQRLTVKGGLYSLGGFNFGRNFYDQALIAARLGIPVSNSGYDTIGVTNYPAEGAQGRYSGGPAEDIIGTGLSLFSTPPGFEDLNSAKFNLPAYQQGDYSPKF